MKQEHYQKIMCQICTKLKWTDEQYSLFMYDCGLHYLLVLVPACMAEERNKMERSRSFWNWWKRLWYEMDMNITRVDMDRMTDGALGFEGLYKSLHYPAAVYDEWRPNKIVWENALLKNQ